MSRYLYKFNDIAIEDAIQLMDDFIAESVFGKTQKPVVLSAFKLNQILKSDKTFKCVVYDDNKPIAMFIGAIGQHSIFEGALAYEIANFVSKPYRGKMIAVRLIKMFEKWCRDNGADGIGLGQSSGSVDINMVRGFYEKLGYQITGFNAMKEFN